MKHAVIKIYGSVQGVNFRHWAKDTAEDLNLRGFVENKSDGSVYTEAEGEEENLEKFIDSCKTGPRWAEVKDVIYKIDDEIENFKGFEKK